MCAVGEFLGLAPRTIRVFAWIGVALMALSAIGIVVSAVERRWTDVGFFGLMVVVVGWLTIRGFRAPGHAETPAGVGVSADRGRRE